MNIGSLFTGYGGLDAAPLHLLGEQSRIVWHSEISAPSIALLDYRDPGVPNLGDLTPVDPAKIEPVDALTFGWPCQPHSAAGKRLGSEDPRALWPHVHRLIAGLRPRFLFGENVARVASNGELRRVARSLAAIGYLGAWHCLRASAVGAPHRRDRLFLFAVRADAAGTAPDPFGQQLRLEPGRVGGADGSGAGVVGDDGPQRAADLTLFKTPNANLSYNGGSQHPDKRKAGGHGPTLADEVEWLLPTPKTTDKDHSSPQDLARNQPGLRAIRGILQRSATDTERWGVYAPAVARWEAVTGWSAPSPTAPGPRSGKPVLSPAFVEWMMGLPAGWVTEVPGLTRSQQLAMLGNGVVPQQALAAFQILAGRMFHVEHGAA